MATNNKRCLSFEGCRGTGAVNDLSDDGSGAECYCSCPAGQELQRRDSALAAATTLGTGKTITQAPKVQRTTPVEQGGRILELSNAMNVYSWSPEPPGTINARSTQVHVHFGAKPGPVMVIRYKSAAALDAVIDALVSHREDVWGKR